MDLAEAKLENQELSMKVAELSGLSQPAPKG